MLGLSPIVRLKALDLYFMRIKNIHILPQSPLNYVIIGYILLALFPKQNFTYNIITFLVSFYAFLYMIEIINAIKSIDDTSTIDFGSFDSIVLLFKNEKVVLAGWTHYICFDLVIAANPRRIYLSFNGQMLNPEDC